MEETIIKLLADSSLGLVIALVVIWWNRKDAAARAEELKERVGEERADKLLLAQTLRDNTVALVELTTLLKRRNGT